MNVIRFARFFIIIFILLMAPTEINGATMSSPDTDASVSDSPTAFEKIETTTQPAEIDGTVIWNGAMLLGAYGNSVTNCTAGRVNTKYGAFENYISPISLNKDPDVVTGTNNVKFGHGMTKAYPYRYNVYQTHVISNAKYMRFWHGKHVMNKTACGTNTLCSDYQTVYTKNADEFGKSLPESFLNGKRAFIMVRGIKMNYGSNLNYIKKFEDANFSAALTSDSPGSGGSLRINFKTDFNGKVAASYNATVYYTIGVYDDTKVSVTNVSVGSSAYACNSKGWCGGGATKVIDANFPVPNITFSDAKNGVPVPGFSAFDRWGFDYSSGREIRRIRGGGRLAWVSANTKKARFATYGEAYREDCAAVGDGSQIWKPNRMRGNIILCESTDVCQSIYSVEAGQEAAWTKKLWSNVKSTFKTIMEKIEEIAKDVVDAGKKLVETITNALLPNFKTFPHEDVLVVLNKDVTEDILSSSTIDPAIEAAYKQHGVPQATKVFPHFNNQIEVDEHVEYYILKPRNIRQKLSLLGFKGALNIPPLHQFYVLTFAKSQSVNTRDAIINQLKKSKDLRAVTENYVLKLKQRKGDPYYAKRLLWFTKYAKTWWNERNTLINLILATMHPETIAIKMGLLEPQDNPITYQKAPIAIKKDLLKTHFQFPGGRPYVKTDCQVAAKDSYLKLGYKVDKSSLSEDTCVPGEIYVVYKEGTSESSIREIEEKFGLESKERDDRYKRRSFKYNYVYELPDDLTISVALEEFQKINIIWYAQPFAVGRPMSVTPSDASYSDTKNWAFDKIRMPEAWGIATGTHQVIVGVIDSGISFNQEDFYKEPFSTVPGLKFSDGWGPSKLIVNYDDFGNEADYQFVVNKADKLIKESNLLFYEKHDYPGAGARFTYWEIGHARTNNETHDLNGHGTSISGIIGAYGNNGKELAGVNWKVKIYPSNPYLYDASSDSLMIVNPSDEYVAISTAISNGAKVINMSYHNPMANEQVRQLIMDNIDVLFVTGAGNFNDDLDAVCAVALTTPYARFPACYTDKFGDELVNLVVVVASDNDDVLAYWGGGSQPGSSYGLKTTHLAAPGQDILRLGKTSGQYSVKSGVSSAVPFVSGAAALMFSYCPTLKTWEVKDALMKSVHKADMLEGSTKSGGRLDVFAALQYTQTNYHCKDIVQTAPDEDDCAATATKSYNECLAKQESCGASVSSGSVTTEAQCTTAEGLWFASSDADMLGWDPYCKCFVCDESFYTDTCQEVEQPEQDPCDAEAKSIGSEATCTDKGYVWRMGECWCHMPPSVAAGEPGGPMCSLNTNLLASQSMLDKLILFFSVFLVFGFLVVFRNLSMRNKKDT